MQVRTAPQLERNDRHVSRSYLRIGSGTSRHQVAHLLEEALRLASLPGEEEGRVYYFRCVSLKGMPSNAPRKFWMDRLEQALRKLAEQAVHGTHPQAGSAAVIYFHNYQEALEALLRHALHRENNPEWFWAAVMDAAPRASNTAQIPAILGLLRQQPIPSGVKAAIIFSALGDANPAALLSPLPNFMVRDWLRELDGSTGTTADAVPLQMPVRLRTTLQQAAHYCGWHDPRTLWLASLAVLCLSPAALTNGTTVKRARSTLRYLQAAQSTEVIRESTSLVADGARPLSKIISLHPAVVFDGTTTAERLPSSGQTPARSPSPSRADQEPEQGKHREATGGTGSSTSSSSTFSSSTSTPLCPPVVFDHEDAATDSVWSSHVPSQEFAQVLPSSPANHKPAEGGAADLIATPTLLGEPTTAAGLYFLLNVLRHLRLPAAIESCPELAEAEFAAHILKEIAAHTGVANTDQILVCLNAEPKEFCLSAETLATLESNSRIWPANFSFSHDEKFDSRYLLRLWTVAARWWCWRMGRITVRDVVRRKGRVWLTRTDLDITLPLAEADIRIRRIGLDIDPGWLPWFGRFGRVVRFHYRDRGPGEVAC